MKKGWKSSKRPSNFVPGKMIAGGVYKTETSICHKLQEEFGMKRILIIKAGKEILKEFFGQMMV